MAIELFLIGLILAAGFAANAVFERTRISQVLILIALGFLLGPALGIINASSGSVLAGLTPIVGTIALIVLLFDGGILINAFDLVRVLPKATAFTFVAFLLSVAGTAAVAVLFMGWSLLAGVLLGAAIGGTSSAIVLAMLERKSGASNETCSLLTVESTITDALCIVTAFVVLQLIKSPVQLEPSAVLNMLVGAFSIAIISGIVVGIAWLLVLRKMNKNAFPYMLTIAAVFLLYSVVEAARGNGGIAVFAFAIVLGNAERAAGALGIKGDYKLSDKITSTQSEVTFFTRTFFFVFLGTIISPAGLTLPLVAVSLGLGVLFLAVRLATQRLILPQSRDWRLVVTMMPRGLAAAVLAGLPAAEGIKLPGFVEIALLAIILTNVIATAGVMAPEKPPAAGKEPGKPRIVSGKAPSALEKKKE